MRPSELKGEEIPAFSSWIKALFDPGSEGIEDTILRYATFPLSLVAWDSDIAERLAQRHF